MNVIAQDMRLTIRRHPSNRIELGIIFGTIAILALAAARVLPVLELLPPCSFRAITGIPCPSCGTTRSLVRLAHGDIVGSLVFNPLFSLAVMTVLFWSFARLISVPFIRSTITLAATRREGAFLRIGIAGVFLANWIYLIFSL